MIKRMRLTIVRHAIAVSREDGFFPGDDRPLTEAGSRKMKIAARGLARILGRPDRILTSPLIRARDTAQIVSAAFNTPVTVESTEALLPDQPATALLESLATQSCEHMALVGHEPGLSMLLGHLLKTEPGLFTLKKGGVAHLDIATTDTTVQGTLLWLMKPKHLRMLGKENDV